MSSTVQFTLFGLTVVLCATLSNALFVIKFGKCPSVTAQATLDTAQYLGVWYEYQRFPAIFEAGLDCTTATYGEDGDKISVTNAGTTRIDLFGSKIVLNHNSVEGSATVPDPAKPAELSVSFGGGSFPV
ncbi:apolipoprotein d-like [Plakobranchus ocellatus]|uniref:Apolipoprotein d-like n=1 Tax=Plakobranchus ocellatus TaxID=259542 RepID=A0AAV4A0X5_9GAST|nr:apolipoprotein d-like [Plakobranchus ocellatus]